MSDPRIEEIARAMARATYGYDEHPPPMGIPNSRIGNTGLAAPDDPPWKQYVPEAKRFIAAHDLAKGWKD